MASKDEPAAEAAPAKKDKKKLIMIVAVLALVAGGYYKFMVMPKAAEAAEEPVKEPGAVVKLDPVTLNLTDGHFLKLGMALQFALAEGGHGGSGEPDGSQALDIAIAQLSNREMTELSSSKARAKAKAELVKEIGYAYHGEVLDVYFTEFVMQ